MKQNQKMMMMMMKMMNNKKKRKKKRRTKEIGHSGRGLITTAVKTLAVRHSLFGGISMDVQAFPPSIDFITSFIQFNDYLVINS